MTRKIPLSIAAAAFLLVLFSFAPVRPVAAQTPLCDGMTGAQKTQARQLFAVLHPYDGCDETFERCLAAGNPKPIVLRLASDICRQVKAGKKRLEIEQGLSKRAQTMMPLGKRAVFTLDAAMRAGEAGAPVTVVIFACARCPFCKVIVPALYQAVTGGALKGKVCLYFKPFPIKNHEGALEGGLAFVGAAKLGRFWPFTLELYQRFGSFSPKLLADWAVIAGMERPAFERGFSDPQTRKVLVASKQEGLRYKVKATPGIFIDGREYVYEMNLPAILDVLEEAFEAAKPTKQPDIFRLT
jgi:protein-disulfide isomerase